MAIYEIPSSHNILYLPPTNNAWKKIVKKAVDEYWIEHIKKMSTYFKSLGYLNASNYSNGKAHAALASVQTSARDITKLPVKLRLMTGTYYLQSNTSILDFNLYSNNYVIFELNIIQICEMVLYRTDILSRQDKTRWRFS